LELDGAAIYVNTNLIALGLSNTQPPTPMNDLIIVYDLYIKISEILKIAWRACFSDVGAENEE
jgi:hypothetical protein